MKVSSPVAVHDMNHAARHRWILILVALTCFTLVGCSGRPTLYKVSGRVVIDGKPVTKGFIQVVPDGQRASTGEIDSEGKFELTCFEDKDGCVPGTHKVAVISNESQGPNALKWFVPKKYSDPAASGLTLTVEGPIDDAEIQLTWEGKEPFVERFDSEGTMPAPLQDSGSTPPADAK